MNGGTGKSIRPETAAIRADDSGPASFLYSNPRDQYPVREAAPFGQIAYGMTGNGNHKIACFPPPVNGTAANFDLLLHNFTGLTICDEGCKWAGALDFGIPGYPSGRVLTRETPDDPAHASKMDAKIVAAIQEALLRHAGSTPAGTPPRKSSARSTTENTHDQETQQHAL